MATQLRPRTFSPSDGSRTITITPTPAPEHDGEEDDETREEKGEGNEEGGAGSLRLTGGHSRRGEQRVMWDEDVVDNEGAGKKSSKICCIYHKPRQFDESSSSSSDDDSSDSDGSGDESAHGRGMDGRPHGHHHHHHGHGHGDDKNAYEREPGSRKKGKQKAGVKQEQ